MDTIKVSMHKKPGIDFRYDSRTSFITTQRAIIAGIKIGLSFDKRVKFGIGYNWLQSMILQESKYPSNTGENVKQINRLYLNYISPYFEYSYYSSKKFELSILVLLGAGKAQYKPYLYYKNPNPHPLLSGFLLMYEPFSVGIYKVVPWFGVGLGIGYRLVFIGNNAINENLNSPTLVVKAKLYTSELLKYLKIKM